MTDSPDANKDPADKTARMSDSEAMRAAKFTDAADVIDFAKRHALGLSLEIASNGWVIRSPGPGQEPTTEEKFAIAVPRDGFFRLTDFGADQLHVKMILAGISRDQDGPLGIEGM